MAPVSARPSATALRRRSGKPSSAWTARPRSSPVRVPAPSASPATRTPSNRSASEAVTSSRDRNTASRRPDAEPGKVEGRGTSRSSANPTGPSRASRRPPPLHCHDPVPRTATPRTRVDTAVASSRSASIRKAAWSASIGQPPTVRTGAVSVPRPRHSPFAHDASPSSVSGSFPRTARASAIRMAEGVSRNGTVTPVRVTSALVRVAASSRPLATGSRNDPLTSTETIAWPATRSWPKATRQLGPVGHEPAAQRDRPLERHAAVQGHRSHRPAASDRDSLQRGPGEPRLRPHFARGGPVQRRRQPRLFQPERDAGVAPAGVHAGGCRERPHRALSTELVHRQSPAVPPNECRRASRPAPARDDELVRSDRCRHPELFRPPEGNLGLRAGRDAPEHLPARRGGQPGHDGIEVGPLESDLCRDGPAFLETAAAGGRESHRGELERRRQVAARDADVEAARPEEDAAERDVTEADRRCGGHHPPLCGGPEARLPGSLQRGAGGKSGQPAERDGPEVPLRPSVAPPVPGPLERQRDSTHAGGQGLDLDPLGVEHDGRAEGLDRDPGEDDARRLERPCPPREACAARQPVAQLRAIDRPRGQGERAHIGLPGNDRPIPRSRRLHGDVCRACDVRRAQGPRERPEIGGEVRPELPGGPLAPRGPRRRAARRPTVRSPARARFHRPRRAGPQPRRQRDRGTRGPQGDGGRSARGGPVASRLGRGSG